MNNIFIKLKKGYRDYIGRIINYLLNKNMNPLTKRRIQELENKVSKLETLLKQSSGGVLTQTQLDRMLDDIDDNENDIDNLQDALSDTLDILFDLIDDVDTLKSYH